MSESKINEEVDKFSGAIGCASGGECLFRPSLPVKEIVTVPTVVETSEIEKPNIRIVPGVPSLKCVMQI